MEMYAAHTAALESHSSPGAVPWVTFSACAPTNRPPPPHSDHLLGHSLRSRLATPYYFIPPCPAPRLAFHAAALSRLRQGGMSALEPSPLTASTPRATSWVADARSCSL